LRYDSTNPMTVYRLSVNFQKISDDKAVYWLE
jgi:hypothetical protein